MACESPAILFIDDDADIVKAARLMMAREGLEVTGAASPDAAWPLLAARDFDVIPARPQFRARSHVGRGKGFAMLARLLAADRDAVIVVVTGHSGINIAVEAMRAGASDFVIKPWKQERLLATMNRAVALRRARAEAGIADTSAAEDRMLLGDNAAIVRAREIVARVAPTDAAVLILGPAGSGKTLTARALHHGSERQEAPLIIFAPGQTTSETDVEAVVEQARRATLLIEEIGAVPAPLQPLLAMRLATIRTIATSRINRAELRAALDEDLLYRVNTIEIALPPLASRREDILLLARHFLALFTARHGKPSKPLSEAAERGIAADAWPDDVRGLRQAMERAVLLGTGEIYDVDDFAFTLDEESPQPRALAADLNLIRSERVLVQAALKRHGFNVSRAANELGLTRAALYRRMAKHGL